MSKEKRLKTFLKLVNIKGKIEELKETKTHIEFGNYYENRLRVLINEKKRLQSVLDEDDTETKTVKVVVKVPAEDFNDKWDDDEIVQFLKREKYINS